MTVFLDDGDVQLHHGDVIQTLRELPAGIAQTCVTSPPYWGLRDYGTGEWTGGDAACEHTVPLGDGGAEPVDGYAVAFRTGKQYTGQRVTGNVCRCGARRVDSQLGLEATPDQYVERLVAVFREVWRVLRDDGTVWLNLGDSYASSPPGNTTKGVSGASTLNGIASDRYRETLDQGHATKRNTVVAGLKPKDLVGIPWRVAFALQADGWYLRSDIVWSKPNPMPESVTDRPTKAHEYLFLLAKRPRYFFDADAIREPAGENTHARVARNGSTDGVTRKAMMSEPGAGVKNNPSFVRATAGEVLTARNRRSVWTIPTEPFPEAHFATYPQALVRPCIQAGTSEHGECVECGAPWVREVSSDSSVNGRNERIDDYDVPGLAKGTSHDRVRRLDGKNYEHVRQATGNWKPSCGCGALEASAGGAARGSVRPQLVLDPFIGSGTTALVARNHGRRCIGIDLSAEYLAIAAKRLQQLSLLA